MNLALLVIDVQRGLFEPQPPPADADAVVERINALSAKAREAGMPVVFVQHERAGDLEAESPGWALHPGLQVAEGDYRVRKATPDSFLRNRNVDKSTPLVVTHGLDVHVRRLGERSDGVTHEALTPYLGTGCRVPPGFDRSLCHDASSKTRSTAQRARRRHNGRSIGCVLRHSMARRRHRRDRRYRSGAHRLPGALSLGIVGSDGHRRAPMGLSTGSYDRM